MCNSQEHSSIHGLFVCPRVFVLSQVRTGMRRNRQLRFLPAFNIYLQTIIPCAHPQQINCLFICSLFIYAFHKSDYRKLNYKMGSGQIW